LAVTFLTQPEPAAKLDEFYKRVRPGGPGWRRVSERLGYGRESIPGGALAWTNWIAGVIAVYATLFGLGKLVFGQWGTGFVLLLIAAAAFAWIARSFRNDPMADQAVPTAGTAVPAD
jgi:SSS family solute:Na+ symporter